MQINDVGYAAYGIAATPQFVSRPPSATPASGGLAAPVDRIEISSAALQAASTSETQAAPKTGECADCAAGVCTTCKNEDKPGELTEAEEKQVKELKARDTEVRAHEAAHAAKGGSFAGSPSFEYQTGPDGKRYAIGGEVRIDTAPIEGDPHATIDKLRQVQAAALAPAEPSDQDRKVAQQAAAALREAQAEAAEERQEELKELTGSAEDAPSSDSASVKPEETFIADESSGSNAQPEQASEDETSRDQTIERQVQDAAKVYAKIAALA